MDDGSTDDTRAILDRFSREQGKAVARGSWRDKEPPAIRGTGFCVDALVKEKVTQPGGIMFYRFTFQVSSASGIQFITAVVFRVHLQRLMDPRLREEFLDRSVAAAAGDDPPYTLDYWRLNAAGSKPERPGKGAPA